MLSILVALFTPAYKDLSSPVFLVRERASATLKRYWPLTEVVINRDDPDPEVRLRCRKIYPLRVNWEAVRVLSTWVEVKGLPVTGMNIKPWVRDPEGFRAYCERLVLSLGYDAPQYYFSEHGFWSEPTGIDYTRFCVFGINPPSGWSWQPYTRQLLIQEWNDVRKHQTGR